MTPNGVRAAPRRRCVDVGVAFDCEVSGELHRLATVAEFLYELSRAPSLRSRRRDLRAAASGGPRHAPIADLGQTRLRAPRRSRACAVESDDVDRNDGAAAPAVEVD